jgi:methyltransferase family protein
MPDEMGDFQTPVGLVGEVLACLGPVGERWSRVIEPTCGAGRFISGLISSASPPEEIQGIELQPAHIKKARALARSHKQTRVVIQQANIFDIDLARAISWHARGPLLVIGNPPWVTNSGLGAIGGTNLPPKSNMKRARGIDAITGSSNFDIAEAIWIKIMRELQTEHPAIALLCKTSVARSVLQFASDNRLPLREAWMRRIDAAKWFGVSVAACLFYVALGAGRPLYEAAVYKDLEACEPESVSGFANGSFIVDMRSYNRWAFIDGVSQFNWRQGVKHDAAQVLELKRVGKRLRNKLGEEVDVESRFVFPLLKGGALFRQDERGQDTYLIVPQSRTGEDTGKLKRAAPMLWRYLEGHSEIFERRKSSIYRGRPPFAIFGIGEYSFSEYKVAISGLHKSPRFRLVAPIGGRPVMMDDTCYFVACKSLEQAALVAALLNHKAAIEFILSIMFADSKRPVTKRLLQRIDLLALLRCVDKDELLSSAESELQSIGKKGRWDGIGQLEDLIDGRQIGA